VTKRTKRKFPLSGVYGLLEPGPVVLVTTAFKGKTNIMAMSWHAMLEFVPPLVACVVSNRNHSFEMLRKTGECGINIPTAEIARKVVKCGNTSGRDIDKFEKHGLTAFRGAMIGAPLVAECYANLECRVVDRCGVAKYNLFILEVVEAWVDPAEKLPRTLHHCGKGIFRIAGKKIELPSRMP